MFQNWMSIQDFVIERQKDLLREADADRIREALRKKGPGRAGAAGSARARGSCRDCPGQLGTAQAGSA
jgi:hypothetical protein